MRTENRSDRTIATYLHGLRQAETFLRARGTTVEAATRADLEAFMADLLARRTASTAATCYKILRRRFAPFAARATSKREMSARVRLSGCQPVARIAIVSTQ